MRRLFLSSIAALIAILILAPLGTAEVEWCRGDPIVRLNGTQVQILVAISNEHVPLVNGPVRVEVSTPRSVNRELLYTDAGFNGYGEEVRFTDLKQSLDGNVFPVQVQVRVPIDGSVAASTVPVEVTVIPDNSNGVSVMGTAERTSVRLSVAGR
jgi:hypothetical protein